MAVTLPHEAIESIVLQDLKDSYQIARGSLDDYYEGKGWLHRDDLEHNALALHHLKFVIEYYGGTVD